MPEMKEAKPTTKENPAQKQEPAKQDKKEEEKTKEQLEQEKILEQTKISLQLDRYEDIFSDFDPRPYSQRSLSFDFLEEAKRASREKKKGDLELRFLVPEEVRKESDEAVIKRRLRDHFKKNAQIIEKEIKKIRIMGAALVLIGMSMMLVATYVAYKEVQNFLSYFLIVLLEPTGWFSVWFGLDQLFYSASDKKSEFEFYRKMSKADVTFSAY